MSDIINYYTYVYFYICTIVTNQIILINKMYFYFFIFNLITNAKTQIDLIYVIRVKVSM